MPEVRALESDAFVFFGATGDLAFRQVFPALQALIRRGHFQLSIIGVAKSAMDLDALRARAHESLGQQGGVDPHAFAASATNLHYVNGPRSRDVRSVANRARRHVSSSVLLCDSARAVRDRGRRADGADTHHGAGLFHGPTAPRGLPTRTGAFSACW